MGDAFYHLIVIAVAVVAVIKGFRRGFTGQVSGILGFAFGTVCAHVFDADAEALVRQLLPGLQSRPGAQFIYGIISASLVYTCVFLIFRILTKALRNAMRVFYVGMLDSLLGAAFSLLKHMIVVSIAYNLIICVFPSSSLMRYARADDGNVVECVMLLAPALLGCTDCLDFAHILQLREARKISRNQSALPYVYNRGSLTLPKMIENA